MWGRSSTGCGCARASDGHAMRELQARAQVLGPVANPADAYWLLEPLVARSPIELAHVTLLDGGGYWRRTRLLARGGSSGVDVPIDRALSTARDAHCRYVLLTHNHPAGWAWPSEADGELTGVLERASFDAGLLLLDHVILGRGQFYSFREGTLWTLRS